MKLEEKYLTESNIQLNQVLKVADKLVTENMKLVSKYVDQIVKEVNREYMKDPDNSMKPTTARDIFLSSYTKQMEDYMSGIVKSIGSE